MNKIFPFCIVTMFLVSAIGYAQTNNPVSYKEISVIEYSTLKKDFRDAKNWSHNNLDSLKKASPVVIVQKQLDAYNARDIDAFLATYTDDIILADFPNDIWAEGKEAMRSRYENMFNNTPNLYCEIKNRIEIGNKVIDQEWVRVNDKYISAVAIYEVEDGLIKKVTFVRDN